MEGSDQKSHSSPLESPLTGITTPDATSGDDDDIWASDDHRDFQSPVTSNNREALLSDLPTIKRQHMTDGYREGLSIGKAKVMQSGFDLGYPIGANIAMRAGKVLGCIEGILAAKNISDESKVAVGNLLSQAKDELAITALLKDMNDQDIANSVAVPSSILGILSKWENTVFGSSQADSADASPHGHSN